MEILVVVFSWLLFGGASSYFAAQRGRDPFAWFLIGMLLGILGLLLLFLLPPIQSEDVSKKGKGEESFEFDPSLNSEVPFNLRYKDWFYLDDKREQKGPLPFSQLKKEWTQEKLFPHTLVWSEGMGSWQKIEDLPDLKEALQ